MFLFLLKAVSCAEHHVYFFLTSCLCDSVSNNESVTTDISSIPDVTVPLWHDFINVKMFGVNANHTAVHDWLVSQGFQCLSGMMVTRCEGELSEFYSYPSDVGSAISDISLIAKAGFLSYIAFSVGNLIIIISWAFILIGVCELFAKKVLGLGIRN